MKYGTVFTETEALLAALNNDMDYLRNLLAGMSVMEQTALSKGVHRLIEAAIDVSNDRTAFVPDPLGHCHACGTDLYVEWEHCPNCRVDLPLKP